MHCGPNEWKMQFVSFKHTYDTHTNIRTHTSVVECRYLSVSWAPEHRHTNKQTDRQTDTHTHTHTHTHTN